MTKVKSYTNTYTKTYANPGGMNIIFCLLFPLLLLSPFFRGLFFDEELVVAHMYTAVVAGLYFYLRPERVRFSRNIMDYAGVGLIIAYILSSFGALVPRDAVGEVFKVLNYFLVFWLVAQTAKTLADMQKVVVALFAAGVGVAIAGLGTAFGTFWFNGGYVSGLINSTIQYHNAVAIYLVAAGILGMYLTAALNNMWARVLVAGGTYVLFLTAFGAGSRGAMLVTPVALLLLFIGLPRVDKEKFFYNALAVLIPFVLTAKSVLTFGVKSEGFYWGMLLLGLLLTCGIKFGLEKFALLSGQAKKKYLLAAGAVVAVAIAVLLAVKGSAVMPDTIAARAKAINLTDGSVTERFHFYQDAVKVVKDYPALGVGGGGWNSIYRTYQSYLYHTTEVHSHPLQVLVEGGPAGLVFYVLLWLGLLISSIKLLLRAASVELKALTWTAFAAAMALGMHSMIDFTLSLGAPMIMLWALFGLVRSGEEQSLDTGKSYFLTVDFDAVFRKLVGLTVAIVFFAAAGSFYIAQTKAREAMSVYKYGNIDGAIAAMESAAGFDPLEHKYPRDLAQLYSQKAYTNNDMTMALKAVASAEAAVQKNKGDAEPLWILTQIYLSSGQIEKGIQSAETAIDRAPYRTEGYTQLAMVYNAAAQSYLQSGNKARARELAEKARRIPERMKAQAAKLDDFGRSIFKGPPIDQISPELQKQLDTAEKLLGQS